MVHPLAPTLSLPSTSHINASQISSASITSTIPTPSIGISRDLSPSSSTIKQTSSESPRTPSSFNGASPNSIYDFSEDETRDSIQLEEGGGGEGGGPSLRPSFTTQLASTSSIPRPRQSTSSLSPLQTLASLSRTTSLPPGETFPISPVQARLRTSRQRSSTTTVTSSPQQPFRFVANNNQPSIRKNQISSPPSASSTLQSHLYTSGLLNSSLSDVSILVFDHLYHLHKILLGQSGFFTSLLEGGFSESRPMKRGESEEIIELEMSIPMTRLAFEFCLTKLYGGGPTLIPPPWSTSTPTFPLSATFERLSRRATNENWDRTDSTSIDGVIETSWKKLDGDSNVQAASPTFLLSLLAQSTYLEIPTVQKEALEMILSTITPFSVGQYLGFSLGEGLGPRTSTNDFEKGIRGLEGVGLPYSTNLEQSTSSATSTHSISSSTPSESSDGCTSQPSLIFVGPEGLLIGRACASFLANKGAQILEVEEWLQSGNSKEFDKIPEFLQDHEELLTPELRVWSSKEGGLSSRWIRGIISSDGFFLDKGINGKRSEGVELGGTGGEFERYRFAKRVVELRRREKIAMKKEDEIKRKGKGREESDEAESFREDIESEASCSKTTEGVTSETPNEEIVEGEDEEEYLKLFSDGIYYSHLTFKQLLYISQDISPTTGLPYTPKSTIDAAFFLSAEFKTHIPLGQLPFSTTTSHATYNNEFLPPRSLPRFDDSSSDTPVLGLAATTSPNLQESTNRLPTTRYFLIPVDDTTKINDGDIRNVIGIGTSGSQATRNIFYSDNFFGLKTSTRVGVKGVGVFGQEGEESIKKQFVPYEPFRFTGEFYGLNELREKQRLYSETFFYAGSSYNVYLQKISSTRNKSAQQLGLYLHRQSQLELFPTPNTSTRTRGLVGSVLSEMSSPPYVDKRLEIQSYFSIWVGNQANAMTRYDSSPSSFASSQSWGWKSSSLASCIDIEGANADHNSMRVTVVLGLV